VNVVDSSAGLAYFADQPSAGFFAEAIEDDELLVVPTTCIHEVFQVVFRERGEDAAFRAVAAMPRGVVVDLNSELAMEAAALGIEEGLSLANSIMDAAARQVGATLWTQDAHFEGRPRGGLPPQGHRLTPISSPDRRTAMHPPCPATPHA